MPTALTPHAEDSTFDVVESVVKDVAGMFPDALLHLGGDEVLTCADVCSPMLTYADVC